MIQRKREKGFTLLEVVISVMVSMAVFVGVGALFQKSSDGLEFFTTVGSSETSMIRSMQKIVDEIRLAQDSEITIDDSDDNHDRMTIQKTINSVLYEMEFAVDANTGQLKKTVTNLDTDEVVETVVLSHFVDAADASGSKGFEISKNSLQHTDGSTVKNQLGNTYYVYDISVRLSVNVHGGEEVTKIFATRVATRA